MDVNQNEYVTWGQVLDMFLENMAPTTDEKLENRPNPLNHDGKFRSIIHTKRESIMKIIGVSKSFNIFELWLIFTSV